MMADLSKILKNRMLEQRMTVAALSELSGIKMGTIHNIRNRRVINPTLHVLRSLSAALGCSVSELIGEMKADHYEIENSADVNVNVLFLSTLLTVGKELKDKDVPFNINDIYKIVEDSYMYSLKKGRGQVDTNFLKWQLQKLNDQTSKIIP